MNTQKKLLRNWTRGNLVVYPAFLGLLHPLIAHGFTGDHDRMLTTPQFIMHTISIILFVAAVGVMHNRIFANTDKNNRFSNVWPMLFFVPWVFWFGYYTLFVPFDILFMFLSIGIITAIRLRPYAKSPAKWIFLCIAGYLLAAAAGILIGLGAYLKYYKDFQGIGRDISTWFSISVPAALVLAFYFRPVLKHQIVQNQQTKSLSDKPADYAQVA